MTPTNVEPSLDQILAENAAEEQAWIEHLRLHGVSTTAFEGNRPLSDHRGTHATHVPPKYLRAA